MVDALPARIDGQGNFGSPGNDPAAAMRYTECRLAPLAMEMLRDIDEDTVDFSANYDGRTQEPGDPAGAVPEPARQRRFAGIAVGMATNIPPAQPAVRSAPASQWALAHPDATDEELLDALLMRLIKGPDFPTARPHRGARRDRATPTAPAAARS